MVNFHQMHRHRRRPIRRQRTLPPPSHHHAPLLQRHINVPLVHPRQIHAHHERIQRLIQIHRRPKRIHRRKTVVLPPHFPVHQLIHLPHQIRKLIPPPDPRPSPESTQRNSLPWQSPQTHPAGRAACHQTRPPFYAPAHPRSNNSSIFAPRGSSHTFGRTGGDCLAVPEASRVPPGNASHRISQRRLARSTAVTPLCSKNANPGSQSLRNPPKPIVANPPSP